MVDILGSNSLAKIHLLMFTNQRELANDTEFINSLTWGKTKKSVPRLLKQYQLPLIVRVVDSVQRTNAEACVHDGQVLVLHKIDSVRKLIGTDNLGRKITIPLSCPTQGLVQPSKCKYASCKVEDFKVIFPKVQYVRVKSVDSQTGNDDESSLKVGDFLQIKKIEGKNKTIHCQNIDTDEYITIPYTSPVIFTPLLDYQKYRLSEIVSNYGLPAKVCFETARFRENSEQENGLKSLNEFVFHKEVSEAQLLATTVAGDGKATQCMGLPTELPIKCIVAKRTAENEASYNNVIESLQAEFNEKNITKKVTLFQDVHGVKLYDFTSLERPERSNAAKSSPSVSSNEPGKKSTESNIVAGTPPAVSPEPKRRFTQASNLATTATSASSPMTKERFTDPVPPPSPTVPNGTLETFSDHSARETEENDHLSSMDDDDYLLMGYVGNAVYEDVDGEDKILKTASLTGQSSTEYVTSTNYTYCYAEVNPNRQWNYKPKFVETGLKKPEGQINTKQPPGYEEVKTRFEFDYKREFLDPKSIIKQNLRPLSTESSDYVIPMVPLENPDGRKFSYENFGLGKLPYENVFTASGWNSEKFEAHNERDNFHDESLDCDEYVEVNKERNGSELENF